MGKFKVSGNTIVRIDNNAGTLVTLSSYIDTIGALGKEVQSLDVTSFADSAERIIAGIEASQEVSISGAWDDTATTGPDAVLAVLPGTIGTIEFYPKGTASGSRKISGEFLCLYYKPRGEVKGRVEYEASFKLDGTISIGTAT